METIEIAPGPAGMLPIEEAAMYAETGEHRFKLQRRVDPAPERCMRYEVTSWVALHHRYGHVTPMVVPTGIAYGRTPRAAHSNLASPYSYLPFRWSWWKLLLATWPPLWFGGQIGTFIAAVVVRHRVFLASPHLFSFLITVFALFAGPYTTRSAYRSFRAYRAQRRENAHTAATATLHTANDPGGSHND